MVVCSDFTSSGNALGLTLENGTAMNTKQGNPFKDGVEDRFECFYSSCIGVHFIIKYRELAARISCLIFAGQP